MFSTATVNTTLETLLNSTHTWCEGLWRVADNHFAHIRLLITVLSVTTAAGIAFKKWFCSSFTEEDYAWWRWTRLIFSLFLIHKVRERLTQSCRIFWWHFRLILYTTLLWSMPTSTRISIWTYHMYSAVNSRVFVRRELESMHDATVIDKTELCRKVYSLAHRTHQSIIVLLID